MWEESKFFIKKQSSKVVVEFIEESNFIRDFAKSSKQATSSSRQNRCLTCISVEKWLSSVTNYLSSLFISSKIHSENILFEISDLSVINFYILIIISMKRDY